MPAKVIKTTDSKKGTKIKSTPTNLLTSSKLTMVTTATCLLRTFNMQELPPKPSTKTEAAREATVNNNTANSIAMDKLLRMEETIELQLKYTILLEARVNSVWHSRRILLLINHPP
jgi:DNA-binding XRE family transcriptional regulator